MFDFYPYEQAAEFEEADRKAMADQSTISDVANRALPDGKKRTFIVTCFPRATSPAQTFRLGTLIINISKYKKLRMRCGRLLFKLRKQPTRKVGFWQTSVMSYERR